MKYNIISINEDRALYKEKIRSRVDGQEVFIPAVDGREVDIAKELEIRGLHTVGSPTLKQGEFGVWFSNYDVWRWVRDNNQPLVVFEDDAEPTEAFNKFFNWFVQELPPDFDLLSLWVPENQLHDYLYDVVFDDDGFPTHVGPNRIAFTSIFNYGGVRLARCYQGYGNVALYYSPAGAAALINRVHKIGIREPVDCFIFNEARTRRINAYAPKPLWARAVTYAWNSNTTIHHTKEYNALLRERE